MRSSSHQAPCGRSCRSTGFLLLAWSRAVSLRVSRVFEAVIPCFLDAHAFEFGMRKLLQTAEDFDAQILRRRNFLAESRDILIQRVMVEFLEHVAPDKGVQIGKVGDHAGGGIDLS